MEAQAAPCGHSATSAMCGDSIARERPVLPPGYIFPFDVEDLARVSIDASETDEADGRHADPAVFHEVGSCASSCGGRTFARTAGLVCVGCECHALPCFTSYLISGHSRRTMSSRVLCWIWNELCTTRMCQVSCLGKDAVELPSSAREQHSVVRCSAAVGAW